jgi:ketosteroid isomerase-like protein
MFKSIKLNLTSACLSLIMVFSVSGYSLAHNHGAHVPDSQSDAMAMMLEYDAKFIETFNRGDIAQIADLYSEDAIQSEPNMAVPLYGRAAIKAAMGKNADGMVARNTLSTEVFTAHDLGNGYIAANGSWEMHDKEGTTVRSGLWGNVFRVVDDGMLMFRESTSRN